MSILRIYLFKWIPISMDLKGLRVNILGLWRQFLPLI